MEEKVKVLVLQLQYIVRKQTKAMYPDVNNAVKSLQDYVQERTASKSGVEDKLKELEDILSKKGEKKKSCTDHIEKIRVAMCLQKKASTGATKSKEDKRKPSSPPTSERATPMPSETKENTKLRSELTQPEETTELSGRIDQNEEEYRDEMVDEVRYFVECINGLKEVCSGDTKIPLEKIIPIPNGKIKKKVVTGHTSVMDVARDISRLKTENQYLRKSLDGLHKYIIGGDETALTELKPPKNMKDNQSIVEVEANVKEVTKKFDEMKTNAENVRKERESLSSILQCLINHVQGLFDGNTEGDISSALDQIISSVKKESQFLTQAKEIIGIQMELKREVEYVACLLEELANVSKSTNNGDNRIILSHPENFGSSRDYKTKDGKKTESSRNKSMQSVQNEKLMIHYGNASYILKQMKEKEVLRIDLGKRTDEVKDLMVKLKKLQGENIEIKNDADSLRTRLGEHAGALLTYENPSIADLSDPNRPTKLAERYLELYDCWWTDAFSNLSKKDPVISENNIIGYLYEMLVDGYRFCEDVRRKQILALEDILFDPVGDTKTSQRRQKEEMSQRFAKHLSDIANFRSNVTSKNMAKAFVMDEKTKDKYRDMIKLCETYIVECVQLCWLMQVQTPPLCLDVKTIHGQSFDKNCYNEYRKRGKEIAFVVWPALFLHENGPLLSKGVAQGQ